MEDKGVKLQERPDSASVMDTAEADRLRVLEEKKARREAAAKIKRAKIRRKRIITLVIVLLVIGGIAFGMYSLFHEEEAEMEILPGVVSRGSITSMVSGVGETKALKSATMTLTSGGTVVLTYRDFVKDSDNNLVLGKRLPVDFDAFAGVCVAETESLQEGQAFPLAGEGPFAGVQGTGGIFRDMLETADAEVLLRYDDPFYQEFAAVTRKRQGAGRVYYLGCGLEKPVLDRVLEQVAAEQRIPLERTESGVEVVYRGSGDGRVRLVINHNPHEAVYRGESLAPFQYRVDPVTA